MLDIRAITSDEAEAFRDSMMTTFGLDPDLDKAMRMAILESIEFLKEKESFDFFRAYALSSVGVDFRVTQVVDGTQGIHGMISKKLFVKDANPYWYRTR